MHSNPVREHRLELRHLHRSVKQGQRCDHEMIRRRFGVEPRGIRTRQRLNQLVHRAVKMRRAAVDGQGRKALDGRDYGAYVSAAKLLTFAM